MATSENDNNGGNTTNSEDTPFAVGSNITLQLPADSNPPSDSSEPFAVGTNMTIQFTDDSGQPQGEQLSSDNIVGTNSAPWGDTPEGSDSLTGDSGANQSPTGDSGSYTWDFSEVSGGESNPGSDASDGSNGSGDSTGMSDSTDMNSLFRQSPWGSLQEVGIDSFEDVFGNVGASGGENPFGGGAGGGENPFGGGAGGGENPFGGGAGGGENPFGGGSNPFGGGAGGGFM
ncbi:hypothetical protein [Chroococcidiopsis sp.]|uniref:hypothetical protein n=1 Tax=Chroococcidiopsis sp. TaxID=3088168 RepID=UPI003F40760D